MIEIVRINILVEGVTEETFVGDILQEALALKGVNIVARRVEMSRKHGRIYRGGLINYEKAKRDIQNWLSQDKSAYLTTMFDLYALPGNFPGFDEAQRLPNPFDRVTKLEEALAEDIQNRRFIPYIQLHEFEGLLFSNIQAIDEVLRIRHQSQLSELQTIPSTPSNPTTTSASPSVTAWNSPPISSTPSSPPVPRRSRTPFRNTRSPKRFCASGRALAA